jgi:hypothetical protein
MKANMLVVDDEPNIEDLVSQKFGRRVQRNGVRLRAQQP